MHGVSASSLIHSFLKHLSAINSVLNLKILHQSFVDLNLLLQNIHIS
jgi:hypothetical protein